MSKRDGRMNRGGREPFRFSEQDEPRKSDLIDIACTILGQTDNAYKIDHGGKDPCWVPKSLCQWDANEKIMVMPEWLAMDKGLI